MSYQPYLLRRIGRPVHAHVAPLLDMIRAPRDRVQEGLYHALQDVPMLEPDPWETVDVR